MQLLALILLLPDLLPPLLVLISIGLSLHPLPPFPPFPFLRVFCRPKKAKLQNSVEEKRVEVTEKIQTIHIKWVKKRGVVVKIQGKWRHFSQKLAPAFPLLNSGLTRF